VFNLYIGGKKGKSLKEILKQVDEQMKYDPKAGHEKIKQKLEDDLNNLGG
jgi:hypothetical protein